MIETVPSASVSLPPLRQELRLHDAPAAENGSPRWTLEDPVRGLFFQLGWLETELLAHWHTSPQVILSRIRRHTVLQPTAEQLARFIQFLQQHQLLQSSASAIGQQYRQQQAGQRWWRWLFRRHLSFRIPLCRPDPWLTRALPWVRPLMTRGFLLISLLAAIVGLWLASHQWHQFTAGFSYLFSVPGMVISVMTIIGVKCLHELGHAFTCKKYQGRVATMGVNFILFWPVLYTDVTSAWRIKQKPRRMLISAAGMLTEGVVAAWALLLWNFVDAGIGRSVLLTLATTSLMLSLSVNLSPLMRFDGYYLFSDWMEMPNLQQRANRLAQWTLRRVLWGWTMPAPEAMSGRRQRWVVGYAFAMWIYRFTLYLGIALAVYHLVFKALGIVLFLTETGWLLLRPCVREIQVWIKNKQQITLNRRSVTTLLVSLGCLIAVIVPWHQQVKAPAVWMAHQQQLLVVQNGQLVAVKVHNGQRVTAGQVLFQLASPELQTTIERLTYRRDSLHTQAKSYPFDKRASAELTVIEHELAQVNRRLAQQQLRQQQLLVRAPFAGTIRDVTPHLKPGDWLATGQALGVLTGRRGSRVDAYVSEQQLGRIESGAQAVFIAENLQQAPVPLTLNKLAKGVVTDLRAHPALGSPYQGPLAATLNHQTHLPEPQQALYLANLSSVTTPPPAFQMRGEVVIEGTGQSVLSRVWQALVKVVIRESVM